MSETPKTCICKACEKKFTPYKDYRNCQNCDEGMEEVGAEYGDGSYYRTCRSCNGEEVIGFLQIYFCCEDCGEDYDYKTNNINQK